MDSLIIFGAKYLFALVLLGAVVPIFLMTSEDRKGYVLSGFIAGVLAFVLAKASGALYFDPRPFTHGVHSLIPHEPDNGFPSDHTTLSFLAAMLVFRFSKPLTVGLCAVAMIVALCRVLSGVHSPIDVLAGAVIGTVAALSGTFISATMFIYRAKASNT